jgi:dTDP-4-amino-4,6-dideoxy-D-galactose acyltransferase
MGEPCQFLEWDSQFFGFPIGRVLPDQLHAAALTRILDWAKAREIRCLYCLCDFGDYDAVRSLEQNGFHLVDIRLTFETTLRKPIQEKAAASDCLIRRLQPSDMPTLQDLAQTSHTDSRFFFDRRFPRAQCGALYRQWLHRDAADTATTLFVADLHGKPAGYLSCRLESADTATISLLGIGEQARGRSIGKQLICAALDHAFNQGRQRMEVVTQGRNIAAQRLYQGVGFRTAALQTWFHRWFDSATLPRVT